MSEHGLHILFVIILAEIQSRLQGAENAFGVTELLVFIFKHGVFIGGQIQFIQLPELKLLQLKTCIVFFCLVFQGIQLVFELLPVVCRFGNLQGQFPGTAKIIQQALMCCRQ